MKNRLSIIINRGTSSFYSRRLYKLYQRDFDRGSVILDKPGTYKLMEDISFNPNPGYDDNFVRQPNHDGSGYLDWNPDYTNPEQQDKYDSPAFRLGFFAAIIIKARNVTVDLNGYTLEQSKEHALQQRFYANIQLGDRPFKSGTGPADFGPNYNIGNYITIKNGKLGRSSHHGIHGNDPNFVQITNVVFEDFEVAAISLNWPRNCLIQNVDIIQNRQDLPVMGTYSAGRFIRSHMRATLDALTDLTVRNQGEALLQALLDSMDDTYRQIMETGETTDLLFRNEARNTDGNTYGVLIHPGFSVSDFAEHNKDGARNVVLYNVRVHKLLSTIVEIVGLTPNKKPSDSDVKSYGGAQNDAVGSVLQIENITDQDGKYKPTVLADVQLFVAKHGTAQTKGRTNIALEIVEWAENGTNLADVLNDNEYIDYICNGDSMHHLNKGVLGFKCDGTIGLYIDSCKIMNVSNHGRMGSLLCGDYEKSHMDAKHSRGYTGADTRGISVAGCRNVDINNCHVKGLVSYNGQCTGIDLFNNTYMVKLWRNTVENVSAGRKVNGRWAGKASTGENVPYDGNLPNLMPCASYVKVEDSCKRVCSCKLMFKDKRDSLKRVHLNCNPNVFKLQI